MKRHVKYLISFVLAFTLIFTSFDVGVFALETDKLEELTEEEQENVVVEAENQQLKAEEAEAQQPETEKQQPELEDQQPKAEENEEAASENIEDSSDDSADDFSEEDSINEPAIQQEEIEEASQEVSFTYLIDEAGNATITGYTGTIEGTLTIPESIDGHKVVSIDKNVFSYRIEITSLKLPDGLESIGESAFNGCSEITSLKLPDSLTSIEKEAFANCTRITRLSLSNGLTSIGENAFFDCCGITSLKLPDGLESIGDGAFCGCSEITSLNLPDSLTSIGKGAFEYCSKIKGELKIPSGVTSIDCRVFANCENISRLKLSTGLESIDKEAFYGCSKITSLKLPNGLTSIGESAFKNCSGITSLELPDGLESIGEEAFFDCRKISSLTIPGSASIGISAFEDCRGIRSLTLSEGVTSIEVSAFEDCRGITSLTLPNGLTSISEKAFYGCRGITKLTIPDSVTSIGDKAFYGCRGITNLTLPDGLTSIGEKAFMFCSGITSLTLPSNLTSIGSCAFVCCSNIKGDLIIPAGVTSISDSAFSDCSNITGLTLPNGLTSIGDIAFSGCSNITGLTLPSSLTSIGYSAFYGCSKMTGKLIIPAGVTIIGNWAFDGTDFTKIVNESSLEWRLPADKVWYDESFENTITMIGSNETALLHGLRYLDILDQVYSASAIKPKVDVYHGTALLEEGKDYSLSYRNNTKVGTAQVIVTGRGNYNNKDVVDFNIVPKDISGEDITVSIADMAYTGKPVYAKPVLKYGKALLREKTDYTLEYTGDATNAGTVTVTITGEGNYKGSTSISYKIYDKAKDISKVYVAPVSQQTYTGLAVTPDITVKATKNDTKSLIKDTDYTVTYLNNINVGNAAAIITGKGDYAQYGNSKKVTFRIVQKSIADAGIEVTGNCNYTGAALRPSIVVKYAGTDEVISPENYTVSYINNTNVAPEGTAVNKLPTAKITGKKNYKGTTSQSFKIYPKDVSDDNLAISVLDVKDSGKAITAKNLSVSVKNGQKMLTRGRDYDVSFEQKEGVKQTAKIEFKGNYKGEAEREFKLYTGKASVADEAFNISLENSEFTYTGQRITPKVNVKLMIDGVEEEKTLTEGRDYKLQYSNNINAAEADSKKAPAVKITGIGAYSGSCTKTFSIKQKELSADDFTVKAADIKYNNGKELKPKVSVTYKGKAFAAANYTVEYSNNKEIAEKNTENAPKATIRGKGNYCGTIETQFRIYKTDISSLKFNRLAPAVYNGFPIKPKETEIFTGEQLSDLEGGRDYTLSYGENTKVGRGTVVVTGIGNYGGTKTLTFSILPKWFAWILYNN